MIRALCIGFCLLAAPLAAEGLDAEGPAAKGEADEALAIAEPDPVGLTEMIMAPGLLAQAPEGFVLRYQHRRHMPQIADGQSLPGAERDLAVPKSLEAELQLLRLGKGPEARLRLQEVTAETTRVLGEYPTSTSNPIFLFYLENIVRTAAVQTGGSPYYFKNRLREALLRTKVPDTGITTIELQPFLADKHAARMGDLASLRLSLTFDPAQPARILELKADTVSGAKGYSESLILLPEPG